MRHLLYVIHFTGRFDDMREFYARGLALPVRREEKGWVEFDTAGASIALQRTDDPARQGTVLRFAAADLDAELAELAERGLEPDGEIVTFSRGRLASFWDGDGNQLQLFEPTMPAPSGAGPALDTLIVNVGDMVAATTFYRDRFGLPVLLQSNWWTELDTGATQLSLHPRVAPTDELRHNAQAIVAGFEVPELEELGRELAPRGVEFSGGPVDQRYGRFAEVTDPDGNIVLFRRSEPRAPLEPHPADEAALAEAYGDDAPARAAMRKPGKKRAKATSRVAIKPAYRTPRADTHTVRPSAGAAKKKAPKRARPGTASGRLHKSERRSVARKKAAVAAVSRRKPVKRAAAKRSGRARG